MKILISAFFIALSFSFVSGQKTAVAAASSANLSKVEVLEIEWHIEFFNPALNDEDPFRANKEARQAQLDEIEFRRQLEYRAKQGLPPDPKPVRVRPIEPRPFDESTQYIYEAKIKNTSDKTIQSIDWDYVFSTTDTKKEIGRRQFTSKVNISPGKIKNLVFKSTIPPTNTIDAKTGTKKLREQYAEKVFIQKIGFADGTIWQAGKN